MKRENSELEHPLAGQNEELDSFRDIRKRAVAFGTYQKRLFFLMGFYWLTASFFLVLPFYFFKTPIYCINSQIISPDNCIECKDNTCKQAICAKQDVKQFVKVEKTLTYDFKLFCGNEVWRMFYKIGTESVSWIGLLIYGYLGDRIGRKLAFKISWRFYAVGLVLCTLTQTQFLISLGYFIASVNCFASLVMQFVLLFQQIQPSIRVIASYLLLSFLLIAPFLAGLLANELVDWGRTLTMSILCTVPAVILSIITSFLQQSALFVYKNSKLHAFNILNKIAKINRQPPFVIDLSRSGWHKLKFYQPSLMQILKHKQTGYKIFVGFFMNMVFYLNHRHAQIELDKFTDQYQRGMIMNTTSSVATVTVILLLNRIKLNKFRFITVFTPFIAVITLILTQIFEPTFILISLTSIALRYVSDVGFAVFLIWIIESYPTVCRTQCVCIVLCGCSFGSVLAYSLYSYPTIKLIISTVISSVAWWLSRYVKLSYQHRLMDTLCYKRYDKHDKFRQV